MRYLILTDLHGNWDALRAVLRAVEEEERLDHVLVLGDLVGYGAEPNEVVEAVRRLELPSKVIRGNHDKVIAGLEDGAGFNQVALAAVRWSAEALTPDNLEYVRRLPRGPLEILPGLAICHGSPLDEDEYLLSTDQAQRSFAAHPTALTFFGHTHIPSLFVGGAELAEVTLLEGDGLVIELEADHRYLVNPGSVGQPRDRDPRAAYLIYDSEERRIRQHRLEYPLERAQQKIVDAGLPQVLAHRLAVGI